MATNARLNAAQKAVARAKTIAREGRDVLTAAGTAMNPASTRKAKDEFQAVRFRSAAWDNYDKQAQELLQAILKGKKGTRSTIHKRSEEHTSELQSH